VATLVLLNFADPTTAAAKTGGKSQTLVGRSAAAIARKPQYGRTGLAKMLSGRDTIRVIDLYELLDDAKQGRAPDPATMATAKGACAKASKVMVCIHGVHDDVDWGLATVATGGGFKIGNFVRYDTLAGFVDQLLPSGGEKCNLALIMCYGARSASFEKNHEGTLTTGDLASSFAYKFFKLLCPNRKIRMTARTGFTGFNEQNGHSEVCTEAAVTAEIDWRELQDAGDSAAKQKASNDAFLRLRTELAKTQRPNEAIDAATARQKGLIDGTIPAVTADETAMKEFGQLQAKNRALREQKQQVKEKYGKFVYHYSANVLKIFRKYPDLEELYSGPLL
jgi:hypothetical protein